MPVATTLTRDADTALRRSGVAVHEPTADDAIDGMSPALVAFPVSTEDVATVVRITAEHGLAVVVRGAGTKLSWGTPPTALDVIVDVSGLDRIVEHAAGDLIVVAQAGVRIAELNRVLARGGQHLALDETVPGATVGGTIGAGTSGPQRVLRGTARDLLIGLTFVRSDGRIVHAGGRVVKNVAGYDVCKLLVGSHGTLGVVTQATFRLHPLPAARRLVSTVCESPEHAGALVAEILHSQTVPSAVEVDWPADGPLVVTTLLEGTSAGVESRTTTIAGLAGSSDSSITDALPDGWGRYPWTPGELAFKLTFGLSHLTSVLACCEAVRRDGRAQLSVRGSAGAGVLYVSAGAADVAGDLLDRFRRVCAAAGGHAVLVDGPAEVKRSVDVWGPVGGLDLMRRVKAEFDPGHRLSRGRFVGGI